MLEMACQGLYRCTYMPDCAGKAAGQLFSLRGAPDEGTIGAKQLVAHAVYHTFKIYSYHCTSTNCLMSSIKKLSFQPSNRQHIQLQCYLLNGYVLQFSHWLARHIIAAIYDIYGCTKEPHYLLNTREKKRRSVQPADEKFL